MTGAGTRYSDGMHALALDTEPDDDRPQEDSVIVLSNATWADYERLLEMRGDHSVPRIRFLEGRIEIMSPSESHEAIKSVIGRLVETWCLERGVEFRTVGSWTLQDKKARAGAEPDECYVFGERPPGTWPDLAIEVVWTRGGLDKLEIYRKLGVREVWFWKKNRITVHHLRDGQYAEASESAVLPGIDVAELATFLDRPTTSAAIREYRDALRARG